MGPAMSINTAIELLIDGTFGLFVGAFAWVAMSALGILSPSKRVVDGGSRFDIPRAVKDHGEPRRNLDCAGPCRGCDVEENEGVGRAVVAASATETQVGNVRCADVREAVSVSADGADDFRTHERNLAAQTSEGHGQ
jgi:hypothetical protein